MPALFRGKIAVICAALCLLYGVASSSAQTVESVTDYPPDALVFAATGDGPRGEEDWTLLPEYFAAEKADGRARYLLHTGDLNKGSQIFDAEYSARVADLYRQSSIPVIFVVGDNEWNDQPDPWAAWPHWEKHFLHFPDHYPAAPRIERQQDRPENIAWLDEGVLFVGVNLVGGRMHDVEEWGYRHRANAEWVEANLASHRDDAFAAVVLAQARPNRAHEDFVRRFVRAVEAFGKPVLYLHGDGHVWEIEENWRAPNLVRIQVDQVTYARPVHIIMSRENPSRPFSFNRHGQGREDQG